ncbi:hypothetical protein EMO37_14105 [Escherichia coli]|nr:hypothetical protein [Escherichia coli]
MSVEILYFLAGADDALSLCCKIIPQRCSSVRGGGKSRFSEKTQYLLSGQIFRESSPDTFVLLQ